MTYSRRKPWPMVSRIQTQVRRREKAAFVDIAKQRNMTLSGLLRFAVRYVIENEGHMVIKDTKGPTKPM